MGPLALCDLIGLDVVLEIVDVLFAESRDPMHAAPPLLRGMVAAGLLGRKSGRGFYAYERPGSGRVVEAAPTIDPPSLVGGPVTLVASTPHADGIAAALASAGVDVVRTTSADLEPAATGTILVEVSPLIPLRDAAVRLGDRRADAVGVHPLHRGPNGLALEIVRGPFSGERALATARALAVALDASPVVCDDIAGLVVGRLVTLYLNDAARLAGSGYADAESIDAAMRLGCGYPVGPMAFLDRFGAGTVVATLDRIHAETGLARHAPVPLLREAAAYGVEASSLVGVTAEE
jgi:3-hydroxybutyryl-CoA dehydrogenase